VYVFVEIPENVFSQTLQIKQGRITVAPKTGFEIEIVAGQKLHLCRYVSTGYGKKFSP